MLEYTNVDIFIPCITGRTVDRKDSIRCARHIVYDMVYQQQQVFAHCKGAYKQNMHLSHNENAPAIFH